MTRGGREDYLGRLPGWCFLNMSLGKKMSDMKMKYKKLKETHNKSFHLTFLRRAPKCR